MVRKMYMYCITNQVLLLLGHRSGHTGDCAELAKTLFESHKFLKAASQTICCSSE